MHYLFSTLQYHKIFDNRVVDELQFQTQLLHLEVRGSGVQKICLKKLRQGFQYCVQGHGEVELAPMLRTLQPNAPSAAPEGAHKIC